MNRSYVPIDRQTVNELRALAGQVGGNEATALRYAVRNEHNRLTHTEPACDTQLFLGGFDVEAQRSPTGLPRLLLAGGTITVSIQTVELEPGEHDLDDADRLVEAALAYRAMLRDLAGRNQPQPDTTAWQEAG